MGHAGPINLSASVAPCPREKRGRQHRRHGNAHDFNNGRQLVAWLGLVPSQYSTGGKSRLGIIPNPQSG